MKGYLPNILGQSAILVENCSVHESKHLFDTEDEAIFYAKAIVEYLSQFASKAPSIGSGYWVPTFSFASGAKYLWSWKGEDRELYFASLGLIFETEDLASQALHDAVLNFNINKPEIALCDGYVNVGHLCIHRQRCIRFQKHSTKGNRKTNYMNANDCVNTDDNQMPFKFMILGDESNA